MTLLYTDPIFRQHITGFHPEHPGRLAAVDAQLEQAGLVKQCIVPEWQPATTSQLERVHDPHYVEHIQHYAAAGGGRIIELRRMTLAMLLSHYFPDSNGSGGRNELLELARKYKAEVPPEWPAIPRHQPDSDPHPLIRVKWNQCILCTRCIRACAEVQGRFVWNLADRGAATQIVAGMGGTMHEGRCESCGACAAYCPTGALTDRRTLAVGLPDKPVRTTCGYCGVGCQFDLNVKDVLGPAGTYYSPLTLPAGLFCAVTALTPTQILTWAAYAARQTRFIRPFTVPRRIWKTSRQKVQSGGRCFGSMSLPLDLPEMSGLPRRGRAFASG